MADQTTTDVLGARPTQTTEDILGPRPQEKTSFGGDLMDSYFASKAPEGRILDSFGQGFKDGWGSVDNYEQDTMKYLTEKGLGKDVLEKRGDIAKAYNQAFMRSPVHALVQGLKPIVGLVGGISAAGVAFGQELTGGAKASETMTTGHPVARALAALPTAAAGEAGELAQAAFSGQYFGEGKPFAIEHTNALIENNLRHIPEARSVGAIGESHEKFLGTEPPTPEDIQARSEATGQTGTAPPPPPPPSIHDVAGEISRNIFHASGRDILQEHSQAREDFADSFKAIKKAEAARDKDPKVEAAQKEIDTILGKVRGVEGKLTQKAATKLSEIREDLDTYLSTDTPEMVEAKKVHLENFKKIDQLAPDVRAIYREAQFRMPREEPPVIASVEPTESGPRSALTLDTEHQDVVSGAFTGALKDMAEKHAIVPSKIAEDASKKFQEAGRPAKEADAVGALVQAHYEARASRFGGKLGTAEELYNKDQPDIAAMNEFGATASGEMKGSYTKAPIDDAKATIRLFKGADASTAVHELGHTWLEELQKDSEHPDAPQGLKDDLKTVRNWMGLEEGKKINRTQHERWARGFERYLMEGVAPSKELQSVFEKFKDWLTKIYETVKKLRSPINDDIRHVFDRLLHNEEEPLVVPDEAEETPHAISENAVYPDGKLSDGSKPEATQYLQKDGSFNLEEIQSYSDLIAAIRQHGEVNDLRYSAAKGKWSNEDVIALKDSSGLKFGKANMERLAAQSIEDGIPTAARVQGLKIFFEQNAREIQRILNMENPSNEDIINFTQAVALHRRAAETLLGVRAEWGRTGRTLNEMLKGAESDEELGSLLQQTIGLDYYQIQRVMEANQGLKGTQKLSKLVQNMQKPSFGQNIFMYWTNNLISGPITHMTYAMSITGNIVYRALIESPVAATVGSLMHIVDKDRPRVTWGEVGDELHKMWFGTRDGVKAFKAALRSGTQQGLQAVDLIHQKVQHEIDTGRIQEGSRDSRVKQLQGKIDNFYKNFNLSEIDKDIKRSFKGKDRKIPTDYDEIFPILAKSEPPQAFELNPSNAKNRFYKMGEAPGSSKTSEIAGKIIRSPGERFVAPIHSINYTISLASNLRKFVSRAARLEGETKNWTPQQIAIRMADLQNNTPLSIIKLAKDAALEENLLNASKPRDPLTLFKRLIKHEYNVPGLGRTPLLGFAQPFVSIITRAAEMGIKSTLLSNPVTAMAYKDIREGAIGKKGAVAQDIAIAKMVLGATVTSALWGLAEQGILNEPPPEDPKERFAQQMYQGLPDGIHIGDMTLDTQRLGGTGLRIGLISDFHKFMKDGEKDGYNEAFVTMLHDMGHHFMQTTAISGLGSLFEAIDDPGRYGKNYWNGFFSTLITPASIGMWQTAKLIDPYQRETGTGGNAGVFPSTDKEGKFHWGEWNALKKSFEEKIPIVRQMTLFPKVDIFGQPVPEPRFYGVYMQQVSNDPVYKFFATTPYFPSPVPKAIKGYTLSEEQYHEFATKAGIQAHQLWTNTINTPGFSNFIPTVQHDMLVKDTKLARAQVLAELESKYSELPKESVRLKKEIAELGAQADKEKELGE